MVVKTKRPEIARQSATKAKPPVPSKAQQASSAKKIQVTPKSKTTVATSAPGTKGAMRKLTANKMTSQSAALVLETRKSLGVTQSVFARLMGVSERAVSGWEQEKPINPGYLRRAKEMSRLAKQLKLSMKKSFIPTWLVTPNDGLGGISPVEALDRGENDRLWRTVFLLGSGMPS